MTNGIVLNKFHGFRNQKKPAGPGFTVVPIFNLTKHHPHMIRKLHSLLLAAAITGLSVSANAQTRYIDEVFPSASRTPDVVYGNNITVIGALAGGGPAPEDLKMDVYTPDGDTATNRPLVIVIHTGTFLPMIINGTPTGTKRDSNVVAMCQSFAKRGYVAAAMTYRLGWNPAATGPTGQDIRTGTLLQAVYRGIQDAKACVRHFRANAATGGNTYGIDPSRIVLSGFGTGGYIALAYATLDDAAEISLPKFLANTLDPNYGFVPGQSYVNQSLQGDFEGYGGIPQLNNPNNSPGYPSQVSMVMNMGGALGDISWLEAGDAPMLSFHVVGDPYAPYDSGAVIVPTTGDFVVDVAGSLQTVERANQLGNNNCIAAVSDSLGDYANTINGNNPGLYPLVTNPLVQSGPWEWYDSLAVVFVATNFTPPPYNSTGPQVYSNALLTNPDMSKAKALAYIDTIMRYSAPRIVTCLSLTSGIAEAQPVQNGLDVLPNPAIDQLWISTKSGEVINSIELFDLSGKRVFIQNEIREASFQMDRMGLDAGMYLLHVKTDQSNFSQRILFR